jgi:hypothetical protein
MKMTTATATRPAVKLVKVEIWLPEDLVKIAPRVTECVDLASIDHLCMYAMHDFACDARLPVSDPVRENYDVLYEEIAKA